MYIFVTLAAQNAVGPLGYATAAIGHAYVTLDNRPRLEVGSSLVETSKTRFN